jgi:hypothetical protein
VRLGRHDGAERVTAFKKFAADEKAILVVFAGAGHVAYGLGIQRQVARLFSGRIAALVPVAVRDEKNRPVRAVRASYADFIWGVAAQEWGDTARLAVRRSGNPVNVTASFRREPGPLSLP